MRLRVEFSTSLWRNSTLFHIPPVLAHLVNRCLSADFCFCPDGTPLGLSKVGKVDETNYEPEEMKWNLKSLRAMKKTIVTMAALMLMAGAAFACAQQPEKKDASAATEATAPATESLATDEQEKSESGDAEKTDSTAGESAKEENKVESTSTSEGNSSSASEASDSAK